MAANAGQQPGSQGIEDVLMPFIIVALILGMGWGIWWMEKTMVLTVLFTCVWGIAQGAQYISFLYPQRIGENLANWAQTLDDANPAAYGADAAILMADTIAHTLMFILLPWILWRVWEIRKAHRINRFARQFDLKRLAMANIDTNPGIWPALQENLVSQPLYEGAWAMNRTPIDWALLNKLVYTQSSRSIGQKIGSVLGGKPNTDSEPKRRYISNWNEKHCKMTVPKRREKMPSPWSCRLDKEACDEALAKQLGGLWQGFDKLDRFERCVAAVFLVAIGKDLDKARELTIRLGRSFQRLDRKKRHNPTIDDKGIDKLIDRHKSNENVKRVLERHAFKNTVFVGLLNEVTKKGIFIANEVLWLKPVNRTLFFSLLQVGSDRPFTEAAGVFAHHQQEVQNGHGIRIPSVEGATDGIEQDLYEEEWIADANGELKSEYEERLSIEDAQRAQSESANS